MKREQFKITSTVGHEVIKTKWNASIRCIEDLIGEVAKAESTVYNLVHSDSSKEGFYHVKGSRTWLSIEGKEIVFFVEKL